MWDDIRAIGFILLGKTKGCQALPLSPAGLFHTH